MWKICFRRLFYGLVILTGFLGLGLVSLFYWSKKELQEVEEKTPTLIRGTLDFLPKDGRRQMKNLTPQNMTDEQRQEAVKMAERDAFAAALASGQSEEMAQAAADHASQQARLVFYPSRL